MGLRALAQKGRFLADTSKSALRKIGQGAQTVRKMAKSVNDATGGMAGAAFEASKSMPGIGTITSNAERGLDMAEKYSKKGIKAIEMGERYAGLGAKASRGDLGAIGQLAGKVGGGKGNIMGLAGKAMKSFFP